MSYPRQTPPGEECRITRYALSAINDRAYVRSECGFRTATQSLDCYRWTPRDLIHEIHDALLERGCNGSPSVLFIGQLNLVRSGASESADQPIVSPRIRLEFVAGAVYIHADCGEPCHVASAARQPFPATA